MSETESQRSTDHDSPWKNALETHFAEFSALLFPAIHQQVDWSKGYTPLDKELQQITVEAESGRRYADKLVKVYANDGTETWVLIHVEVQGEPEDAFAERMYTYQYRLRDRYGIDVVSIAVLADTRESFRPTTFYYERWGCEVAFTFPMAKLIDWEAQWEALEASDNVFALVIMAQLRAKRLTDGNARTQAKIKLVRLMFERNYSREQIQQLFIVIDWMLQLPYVLEPTFRQAVYEIQEAKKMPYINTFERHGIEKGLLQGREEGHKAGLEQGTLLGERRFLTKLLNKRFGELPGWAQQRIEEADETQLERWADDVFEAHSLDTLLGSH
ncbi:DUF4351 domain-containing protein [Halomonas meridiana]|uniref:DUF4351 domain-containing protein n=1 Tax=Vreelandella aquamarina TaxID=77097 RepID=UPI001E49E022|nr:MULTISPECIES: DUF4351 domain-containing protein [Halomonas]MCD1652493.1 DUF4351 domain-containing protein [Halomonas axialensis]MCD2089176.1 DUF4351 domain-containing protein [Halomonas meridiana]